MNISNMRSLLRTKYVAAASVGLAMTLAGTVSQAQDADTRTYRVEVTNIMAANQLTPL